MFVRFCTRRCNSCGHSLQLELPEVSKQLVYLDQLVISNFWKVLDHRARGHLTTSKDTRWLTLYLELDHLRKLHLLVCPSSGFHFDESLELPDRARLLDARLSNGCTFRNWTRTRVVEATCHFQSWLTGSSPSQAPLGYRECFNQSPHSWTLRDLDRTPLNGGSDLAREHRASVDRVHAALSRWPEIWRRQTPRSFDLLVAEQVRVSATTYIQLYLEHQDALTACAMGTGPIDPLVFPNPASRLIYRLMEAAVKNGESETEAARLAGEFLLSPDFGRVPNVLISALLFAGLQHAYASGGRKQCPSPGTTYDVMMIASVLPYVNAIFVDKEMHGLLTTNPVRDRLPYHTKVFCPRTWREFLNYLEEIKHSCPDDHRKLANCLAGEGGCGPDINIFL